jgi:hypothetical protein
MVSTPVVTIPRDEYSRRKIAYKKTAPPISRRRGFRLQTLVAVITAMTATVVAVIQVAVQISLRCSFVRSLFLDFRLLASRRTEIAIFQILALFRSVMMDTALVVSNLAGVVAHILIVRRMCERKHQQRTECACY